MNDLTTSIVNIVTRVTILLLAAFFLGWALYPVYQSEISGLILGLVGGLFNVRYLSIKVRQLAELAVSRNAGGSASDLLQDFASRF